MADGGHPSRLRHLAGLCMAVALALGAGAIWVVVPMLVQGTFLERLELLVLFLCLIALLTLAERIWVFITTRPHDDPPR